MKFRILLLFCLLSSSLCPAKERQLIFRSFNADNGLAHNTVLAVIQDRTGFMWFGTKDGLNRYDGSEIRTVAVTDAIPGNNYISALCEDNKGCIWIGTDSGVCLYDPETERANRFLLKADDGSRITENIPQIVLAPDSTVWIAAGSQGFFRYDSGAKTLTRIPGDKTGRKTYSARNICFTAQNAICITLDDGNIYLSEDNLASVTPLFPEGGGTEAFRNRYTNRLVSGAFNKMYACTSLGLFEINLAAKRFRKIDLPHSNNYVRDLLILKNDEFWVATESALEILDANLREAASLYGDHRNPYTFQDYSVYCLCQDKEGGIWAGTYFAGVAYSWGNGTEPVKRYYANPESRGLGHYVREIVSDADGNLWIGTESKSLFHYVPQSDKIEPVWNDRLLSSNIHGLCCDGDFVRANSLSGPHPPANPRLEKLSQRRQGDLHHLPDIGRRTMDRNHIRTQTLRPCDRPVRRRFGDSEPCISHPGRFLRKYLGGHLFRRTLQIRRHERRMAPLSLRRTGYGLACGKQGPERLRRQAQQNMAHDRGRGPVPV